MDECQVIMGVERGKELRSFLEGLLGDACPCAKGVPCPLLSKVPHPRKPVQQSAVPL
jgi:hypothetical protein